MGTNQVTLMMFGYLMKRAVGYIYDDLIVNANIV